MIWNISKIAFLKNLKSIKYIEMKKHNEKMFYLLYSIFILNSFNVFKLLVF